LNKILLFNPAISSLNMGDHIISEACKEHLEEVLFQNMNIEISTHLPVSNIYMKIIKNVKYSFVIGSNLLMPKMNGRFRQWDIKMHNLKYIFPVILMGAGWHQYSKKANLYTKILYTKVLSKNYIHSVRDEYTKEKLKEIGITNVLNTGCPTFWNLTKEHCKQIPVKKADKVVFTLTDYNKDIEKDRKIIDVLKRNYKEVFFWVQGSNDLEYLESINGLEGINIVSPTLEEYNKILDTNSIDFVGTRLHGGIRALQHKRRTLIIAVDNRAVEINKNYNIPIIKREEIDLLEDKINNDIELNIKIPEENIKKWKEQFK